MIFLVLLGKIMFLFLENMILTLGGKWKMIFFKKIQGNMIFSSSRDMIFLVLSGKIVFFPWAGSQQLPFSRNTWRYDIFCVDVWALKTWCHAPPPHAKENQRWPYSTKIHLKVIDVLDWHLGKSSSNSLFLQRDLYRRFHILLSSEKKNRKLNI